ncbi:MAG TPA: hypothetical protein VFN41_08605 [Candidatus Limnocylindrales bacterium]|nr:hypothetical protein [Candidatus Limnocylindrales bacterium]
MSGERGKTIDPEPLETEPSAVAKWAAVVIVGEVSLVTLVLVLGSVVKIGDQLALVLALAMSILIGGRFGGVRGALEWVMAAVLIVGVGLVLLYLFILAVVSQITGP